MVLLLILLISKNCYKGITQLQYVNHYPQNTRSFFLIGTHHNTTLHIKDSTVNRTFCVGLSN
jgi:hypothetical protein